MNDVEELSVIISIPELILSIGTYESREPVIGDNKPG